MLEVEHLVGLVRHKTHGLYDTPDKHVGGIQKTCKLINHTRWTLTLVDRNNIRQRVTNTTTPYTQEFIIREEYLIQPSAFDDLQRLFVEKSVDNDYKDLEVFRDAFYLQYEQNKFRTMRIVLDCVIHESTIQQYRTLYIANRDTLISLEPPGAVVDHPYSYAALKNDRYKEAASAIHGLTISLELIDNEKQIGDRYVYFAKSIMLLRPIRDHLRASGIYLGVTERDEKGQARVNTAVFNLEEAEEKLGLYKTREEALSGGDVKSLRQEQVAEMQHQYTVKQMELKEIERQLKEDNERLKADQLNREMKIKQLEAQMNKEKMEAEARMQKMKAEFDAAKMKRESYYEDRSYQHKDNHDWFKLITGVLVGGLGVAAVVMKK